MDVKKAWLILEDGTVFTGDAFGGTKEVNGELVFTTAMTGYQETLTDPSYAGQILCQTFPLIGNYGVNHFDAESDQIRAKAYIVRNYCDFPSNYRSETTLETYLKDCEIPGICHLDTRALVRHIRSHGAMNAALVYNYPQNLKQFCAVLKDQNPIKDVVYEVSCKTMTTHSAFKQSQENKVAANKRVVLYDYGTKRAIIESLQNRVCEVIVLPCDTPYDVMMKYRPDGVMLSNGPGDPSDYEEFSEIIKKIMNSKIPIFGVCLGHQLLARAFGGKTEKLKFGHRGSNQPVTDLQSGRTYITTQNHGYAVVKESLREDIAYVRYLNANDGSVAGIDYLNYPAFSVQFHPEASAGPEDTSFLFDRFIQMMTKQ